ncbi:Twinfilin-1 [Coemansia biformis]|uniref:Twinfilin-1 n=1 Tax=Coemansia biformis TaxID=1286918 RepID=A0A9W7YC07_9FUNG|nr:Twinfilin-1 [Coemansia biformis]
MSSLTSGISAAPALQRFLDEARAGEHPDVAAVRVQIRGDDLVETARKTGPANGDLALLEEYLDDSAALFLLRDSTSSWYVVLWMPEGKVGVSNRMVYAASQPRLKAAVGDANVAGALQFTTLEEVFGNDAGAGAAAPTAPPATESAHQPARNVAAAPPAVVPKPPGLQASRSFAQTAATTVTTTVRYEHRVESQAIYQQTASQTEQDDGHRNIPPATEPKPQLQQRLQQPSTRQGVFVKKADPRLTMSRSELDHVDMLQQEDDARSEQLTLMRSRLRSVPGPAKPVVDTANHHANNTGIKETVAAASGGFHAVALPLSPDAKDALGGFTANVGTTVVELQVEANKCVSSARSFASTEDFAPNASEPRFYVMRTPGSRIFVYSCPESSPPRLRMVYSTASASTLEQIQELGCKVTHRLSLFSPKECTLIAVAATIRSGQAQRVGDNKSVDAVVSYVPSTPARSLPSRFSVSTTKPLEAFADESGFRQAFSNVRPDAPTPAPFKSPVAVCQPHLAASSDANDSVDSSPNTGAAAWGLRLKSSGSKSSVVRSISAVNCSTGVSTAALATATTAAPAATVAAPAATTSTEAYSTQPTPTHFSHMRIAGEAGDDSPASGVSRRSTPPTGFTGSVAGGADQAPESMRSSLPGLRSVAGNEHCTSRNSTPVISRDAKWDPWRSVSATTKTSAVRQDAPESALQSSVFTKDGGPAPGTIADFMSDIIYPPLQQAAGSGTHKATS